MKSALFIRLDRMGDLILTLPCDERVSQSHRVHWIIPSGLDFVGDAASPPRSFNTMEKLGSWENFKKLRSIIKTIKPEVSVSFHVPWWVNFCLWFSGVRTRGGVLSQWHSYLFLNKGLRQKRSQCEHHELEYNFLLTEHVFDLDSTPDSWSSLELVEPKNETLGFETDQDYYVVHPGMGGSALNWPTENYVELITQLSKQATVVITGTKSDDDYLRPIKLALKENPKVVWLDKQLSGSQLLILLNHAKAVVAPSTGVLHLSASLGVPSVGIYSPIQVHRPQRWGPKGRQVVSFEPTVSCPAQFECLKEACQHYPCMSKMSVTPTLKATLSH